eukprot:scaffold28424_cov17-Tisochrysis_lutea.AAC.1
MHTSRARAHACSNLLSGSPPILHSEVDAAVESAKAAPVPPEEWMWRNMMLSPTPEDWICALQRADAAQHVLQLQQALYGTSHHKGEHVPPREWTWRNMCVFCSFTWHCVKQESNGKLCAAILLKIGLIVWRKAGVVVCFCLLSVGKLEAELSKQVDFSTKYELREGGSSCSELTLQSIGIRKNWGHVAVLSFGGSLAEKKVRDGKCCRQVLLASAVAHACMEGAQHVAATQKAL